MSATVAWAQTIDDAVKEHGNLPLIEAIQEAQTGTTEGAAAILWSAIDQREGFHAATVHLVGKLRALKEHLKQDPPTS